MLIYDIFPPGKIKEFTKERVFGIKDYKTKGRKYFAFGWRAFLLFFIFLFFFSGITPFTILQKTIKAISHKEKTINFYATLCAGNWQNPQNAQGPPEVRPTGDINSFSKENSAVYGTGPLNLICQNFATIEQEIEVKEGRATTTEATTTLATTTRESIATDTGIITTETTSTTTTTTNEPTSFFEKIKKSFENLKAWAQEDSDFQSAKIKLSFAVEEQQATPNQSSTSSDGTGQATTTELETNSTSSEESISFWNKIKSFFVTLIARAEEDEENATDSGTIFEPEPQMNEATTTEEATITKEVAIITKATTTTTTETNTATTTEATTTEATTTATSTFQETTTTTEEIATGTATTTEILTYLNEKIIIWYSLDGEVWGQLGIISDFPLSNALNGGYFEYNASFLKNWENVRNLKIKFEGVIEEETNVTIYLDSAWVEVTCGSQEDGEKTPEKEKPVEETSEITLLSLNNNFKANEEPEFRFKYKKNKNTLFTSLGQTLGNTNYWEDINTTLQLTNSGGEVVDISSFLFFENDGEFLVKIRKPREFKPGLYKIILTIENGGDIQEFEQDFSWGALAINTNKSIYLPGEEAYLQMAVLDNKGWMVCNADLTLEITSPFREKTTLKTSDRTIIVNPECRVHDVTERPDYEARYVVDGVGKYLMTLTAVTQSGTSSITDSFEVRDSVPFDIERRGPTRILPSEPYTMKFNIKVNQNFNGIVREVIPESFEIKKTELFLVDTGLQSGTTSLESYETPKIEISIEPFRIITQEDKKTINWTVQWQKNQIYELSYQFDAPDISPYFYLLGPLQIGNFQETRQWQIAADAIGFESAATPIDIDTSSGTITDLTITDANILLTQVYIRHASVIVDTITHNNKDLTFIRADTNSNDARTEIWYRVNPDVGTYNIVVTLSSSAEAIAGAIGLTGASTTEPLGANAGTTGTGSTASTSITTLYDNSWIVGIVGGPENIVFTPDGSQTTRWELSLGGSPTTRKSADCTTEEKSTAGGDIQSWALDSPENWAVTVVEIRAAPAENQPPQVDSVSLNASSTIILSPNGTTSVSATTSVSDPEGCSTISTTTAVIYREGVTSTSACTQDDNNCYIVNSCTQDACSGNNATYTCTIAMEFFAEPTDEGTYAQSQGWHTEEWIAFITVYDDQDASATGSNEAIEEVDVQTLLAFELSTTTIGYGKVNPNETSIEQTTTISTIGNVPIDINASGTDMSWNSNDILVTQQHWSTTTGFNWGDGTPLETTSTSIELESDKPTQRPTDATDDVYWKLKVPLDKQSGGPYEGQTVFIEVQD